MIALVVVFLTVGRRITYNLKVCSCLNENMITITLVLGIFVYARVGKANPNTNQLRGGTRSAEYQEKSN